MGLVEMDNQSISSFRGEYDFLSNFYHAPIVFEGIQYLNNEAAFQAQKECSLSDRIRFSELTPSQAKQLGKCVKLRSDWEQIKEKIMYEICRAKFEQHVYLRKRLIATGDIELIEGNTWKDRFWGVDGYGQNKLGFILMRLRAEYNNNTSI